MYWKYMWIWGFLSVCHLYLLLEWQQHTSFGSSYDLRWSCSKKSMLCFNRRKDIWSSLQSSRVPHWCSCVRTDMYYMCVWETNLSQWTLTPIQKATGAFCEEFMSSSESVWKQQFFATLLTDPLDLTHLSKPIIPFSPSLLLHLDQSPIETSNRTVLSYFVFSLLPILPHAIPKKITY